MDIAKESSNVWKMNTTMTLGFEKPSRERIQTTVRILAGAVE